MEIDHFAVNLSDLEEFDRQYRLVELAPRHYVPDVTGIYLDRFLHGIPDTVLDGVMKLSDAFWRDLEIHSGSLHMLNRESAAFDSAWDEFWNYLGGFLQPDRLVDDPKQIFEVDPAKYADFIWSLQDGKS
ncbi:MAG TPA: hypothetical protein VI759_04715 [Dehalococcoidia bacterium]|nr:hypothetical protein [Dehalococcoidia bacterium]